MSLVNRIKVIIDVYADMVENAAKYAKIDKARTFDSQLETTSHPTGLALLRSDIREAVGTAFMGAFMLFWVMLLLLFCSLLASIWMMPLALGAGAGSIWYLSRWRTLQEQHTRCMVKLSQRREPEEINVP